MLARARISEKDERGVLSQKYLLEGDRIVEADETGKSTSSYRISLGTSGLHMLTEVFLPSGFPESVTSDYIWYQLFDSLQAFSSSIAGLLSSRAVLEGFGVGDENASSTNAVLLSVVQDATGRLATIFFAWKWGPAFAPEAKMYRLAADVFNDSAFILDCLSPALPSRLRVAALCLSGALRAVCGVCGGGAKSALSVHFARAGNVSELNAKDASQETVIGLLGMLCGSYAMAHINSRSATWTALLLFLFIHLGTNYLAVRAVTLVTLNRQRANIAYGLYCARSGVVPTPSEVARRERIFEIPGALREPVSGSYMGACTICVSAKEFLDASARGPRTSGLSITDSLNVFRDEAYFLTVAPKARRPCSIYLCFKDGAGPSDRLKAWLNVYELARLVSKGSNDTPALPEVVRSSLETVGGKFPDFIEKAREAGWDLSTDAVVTQSVRHTVVEYPYSNNVDEKKSI
ncbi:hypothetical protein M0805_008875 [Coniferiporia weirii]|nr:hypothetical protein M0805_008875 [Coniferiporia weirii]